MKKLFSWHEQKEVIMLEENEWKLLDPTPYKSYEEIKNYRLKTGCSLSEAKLQCETFIQKKYLELTGEKVENFEIIYKRRLSDYGPICESCGKPYRTPKASLCAECGHKKQ
jgi:hypothetical protein